MLEETTNTPQVRPKPEEKWPASIEDYSIVLAENEFLARREDFSIARPGLWPSEASVQYEDQYGKVVHGQCLRAAFYRAMDFPKDGCNEPGLEMKADLGKRAEAGCIDRWKSMGIWVQNNVKFYNHDLVVSGELDAIIKHEKPGEIKARIGVEVKSFYGYYANSEICGGKRPPKPGKPKMDHFLQALNYKSKYKNILDQYRLYYLERGDGHRVEFEVGLEGEQPFWRQIEGPYWGHYIPGPIYTPFKLQDMEDRYKQLLNFIRTKTLPPRDYEEKYSDEKVEIEWMRGEIGKTNYEKWKKNKAANKLGHWRCSYCPWRKRCNNDSIGE